MEEFIGGTILDQPAVMQEKHPVCDPARLPQVVCGHHDRCASRMHRQDDSFDLARSRRIEACGWLIQQQQFGIDGPRSCQCYPLLLTNRAQSRGTIGETGEADPLQCPSRGFAGTVASASNTQRKFDVLPRGPAEKHRPLEHHRLSPTDALAVRDAPPDNAISGSDQSVKDPK